MTLLKLRAIRQFRRMVMNGVILGLWFCYVVGVSAIAQTTVPQSNLGAPADSVDYYWKLERANRLVEEQKWPEAEAILMELTSAHQLNGATWGQLAVSLRRQNKHSEAIRAYEKVIVIQGPGLPYNARYWIAASYAALGNHKAALDTLERLVFKESYLNRPGLIEDPNFASLKNNPRLRAIAGVVHTTSLSRIEGWRRDIDFLVAELKRNNPEGSPIPEEFFRLQRQLKASVPKLSDYEVVKGLGQMMNTLERGHTAFWFGERDGKLDFRQLPIRLYAFPEGLFIIEDRNGALAGAQVLKFGNTEVDEALRLLASIQSNESAMETIWVSPHLLTIPAVLKALGIAEHLDRAELTLRMTDGTTVVKTIEAVQPCRPNHKLDAPPKVQPPRFLRKIQEAHWLEALPEHEAIYVQINNIIPDKDETMPQFGLRLRSMIADLKPGNIIVDIRHNNGGNTFTYLEVLRTLTAFSTIESHKVYVLIGRNVYSAAGNLSADLERLVRPIFVGEPTSQTGNQWGDESYFILPYSGLSGAFAGVKWQISHPWDKRRSIIPHVPVQRQSLFSGAGSGFRCHLPHHFQCRKE